jgi:hypothetical protein
MKFHTAMCIIGAALLVQACRPDDDLPKEPVINEIAFDAAERVLTLRFTDGDGNVGLAAGDTLPPFQPFEDPGRTVPNRFHYNMWVDYYEKRNGEWVLVETPGTFDFRMPIITPTGQNKQLRVKATYDMSSFIPLLTAQSDTLRFSVRIADRSLNVSNMKEVETVVVP